jgi:hypothetical protein
MIIGNYIKKTIFVFCELWEILFNFPKFWKLELTRKIYYYLRKILFLDFGKSMDILFNFLFLEIQIYEKYCYYLRNPIFGF